MIPRHLQSVAILWAAVNNVEGTWVLDFAGQQARALQLLQVGIRLSTAPLAR